MTNLGATYDAVLSGKAELETVVAYLSRAAAKIAGCRATSKAKRIVMETHVVWKLLYVCKFLSVPLATYRRLDKHMDRFWKRISKCASSFPTDVLYLPRSACGLGLYRFSDLVQQEKWGMMCSSAQGNPEAVAMMMQAPYIGEHGTAPI